MKVKKIVAIIIVLAMLTSVVGFSGCGRTFTEEEHIERITARLQERYFYEDGTPTSRAVFRVPVPPDEEEDNSSQEVLQAIWQYVTLERFEVQILSALGGAREHFLTQLFPVEIGFIPGVIFNSEYRLIYFNRGFGLNPFDKYEIAEDNRYNAFLKTPSPALSKRNEEYFLTRIHDGHIWTQANIDWQLHIMHSRSGRRTIRQFSVQL